jgi:hypothetical protein
MKKWSETHLLKTILSAVFNSVKKPIRISMFSINYRYLVSGFSKQFLHWQNLRGWRAGGGGDAEPYTDLNKYF